MAEPHNAQEEASAPGEIWEPRIIAFLCYWCSYTGADNAGTARIKYPPNVDIIRVMCSGRIDPELITTAFSQGADGVMVCGCHIGDCHYQDGNHKTAKRADAIKLLLEDLGVDPERFELYWVSAAEGPRFAQVVTEFTERIQHIGPNPVRHPKRKAVPLALSQSGQRP